MSELRRLHLLVELSRRGTIAAVAEASSYSTSGISQQLAALERDIGASLLERDGRRLTFTPAGAALLAEAPQLLDAWERARSRALAASGHIAGTLRLGIFQTGLLAIVPGLLDTLAAAHPGLDVRITHAEPETAIPAVRARELDAAVIESYPLETMPRQPELHHRAIGTDPMLIAVPARSAHARSLADLSQVAWVFEAPGSAVRNWAERLCRQGGFEPDVRYQTSDVLTQLELVRQDRAAAFVPALTPEHHLAGVAIIPLAGQARTLHLVTRASTAHAPATRALDSALRAAHLIAQ